MGARVETQTRRAFKLRVNWIHLVQPPADVVAGLAQVDDAVEARAG